MDNELENKLIKDLKSSLEDDFSRFLEEVNKTRGLRVNIESVRQINIAGLNSKLSHVSNISNSQRELIVEPFEKKNYNLIIKSILDSELGYKLENSSSEKIYFSLMPLNQEIKNKIIVSYKQKSEEAKISMRKTRQKFINLLKTYKLTSDEDKRFRRLIDEAVRNFENEISKVCEKKTKDLINF